jgi:hypothetical protein
MRGSMQLRSLTLQRSARLLPALRRVDWVDRTLLLPRPAVPAGKHQAGQEPQNSLEVMGALLL